MLLNDFKDGGFPISNRAPVICIAVDGAQHVAYNRFDLKKLLNTEPIRICIGVWPGKRVSDCFRLSVAAYKDIPVPPEEHKHIDSAESIVIKDDSQVEYKVIKSIDPALVEYIKAIGLKHAKT